jgi:SecD/SecF fusion protein
MSRLHIDFMGNRKWFYILSGVLLVIAIAALLIRGLHFGIEFRGGTVMEFSAGKSVTVAQMRSALREQKITQAEIQAVGNGGGFLVRTGESDPAKANAAAAAAATKLGLPSPSVTTIGPGWGKNISDKAIIALIIALSAILLYVSVRFEYKMSITAIISLVHDVTITLGVYALVGREVTPNTVAALLTILGYSLYDTIVVFHRVKENSQRIVKQTFGQMANDSINQVLVRSINTVLVSLIPVICLLLFGGETLKDFAFAMTVGLMLGAYSSIGVAAPIYVMWKETEPKYEALEKKYGAGAA